MTQSRRPQGFDVIISNVKTLGMIRPNFCGLLRISELYSPPSNHLNYLSSSLTQNLFYSVSHIITYPSKELCSKMALGEGGVSLP